MITQTNVKGLDMKKDIRQRISALRPNKDSLMGLPLETKIQLRKRAIDENELVSILLELLQCIEKLETRNLSKAPD